MFQKRSGSSGLEILTSKDVSGSYKRLHEYGYQFFYNYKSLYVEVLSVPDFQHFRLGANEDEIYETKTEVDASSKFLEYHQNTLTTVWNDFV